MTVYDITRTGDDTDALVTLCAALIARTKLGNCIVLDPDELTDAEDFDLRVDTGNPAEFTVIHVVPSAKGTD